MTPFHWNASRRGGVTLIEVLVAIFLMGIGMLALLTLFPIGVLRMQQAMNDDRSALASANAMAIANSKSLRSDSEVTKANLFENPDKYYGVAAAMKDADPDGPSYPVFVDPTGWLNAIAASPNQRYVAGVNTFPRIQPSYAKTPVEVLRWFAVNDEILFDDNGVPSGNPFDRNTKFTWAYLLQRPRTSDPSLVNMSVVVFNGRPVLPSVNLTPAESIYSADFDLQKNTVLIDASSSVDPNLSPGSWIMDATVVNSSTNPSPHANFYRVVSVTEQVGPKYLVELQTPIRGFPTGTTTYTSTQGGRVIVLDGVYEVFEKGVGRQP